MVGILPISAECLMCGEKAEPVGSYKIYSDSLTIIFFICMYVYVKQIHRLFDELQASLWCQREHSECFYWSRSSCLCCGLVGAAVL